MAFKGTARFRLIDRLGEGGMGIVYDAYDRTRGMRVALKTLRQVDATSLYRFKREFRSLSDLSHPNIIALYELFSEEDEWFFTMEMVEGQDFLSYARDGRPGASDVPAPLDDDATRTAEGLFDATHTVEALFGATRTLADASPAALSMPTDEPSGAPDNTSGLPLLPDARTPIAAIVDITRLRDILGQLAAALQVLHAAGLVHRDLKPSNVRVTPAGRVVLMDFGMVAEARPPIDLGKAGAIIGTPAFMAPEQVVGAQPTASADWYALGVILYVALTGRLPYEGTVLRIVDAKQDIDPLPPSAFVDGIPDDLERLCLDLLQRDPLLRSSGAEVITQLGTTELDLLPGTKVIALDLGMTAFVGRKLELEALHAAYQAVCEGDTQCVLVQGLSGMGKTCLVERFMSELHEAAAPDAASSTQPLHTHLLAGPLVFAGRCHERESLPYKAFDGVMDSLTGHLLALSDESRMRVLPANANLIARLFPVLRRVPGIEDGAPMISGSPIELREWAVASLRALLTALARHGPLVIHIEDVQWADRESLELLLRLLSPAPIPGLMVVATVRAEELAGEPAAFQSSTSQLAEVIEALEEQNVCRRIVLGPLSDADQRALVGKLARTRPDLLSSMDEQLWQDTAGNPMLLVELARYAQEMPDALAPMRKLRLEDLLWRRITHLPEAARVLMETIAVAGEPTPLRVLADAGALSRMECERAASILRLGQLSRTSRIGGEPWLNVYHDKVREAVTGKLETARGRDLHLQLARALESWGHAPVALMARHRLAAGDRERAAMYFIDAARGAADQLAFDRAVELYRTALTLIPGDTGDAHLEKLRCHAWIGLAEDMRTVDRGGDALALLDRAVEVATDHQLIEELATIHYLRGSMLFPRGDLDGCLAEHAKARAYARQAGSTEREAQALSGLGDAYYMRGRMISAHEHFSRCIELCREHGFGDIEVANLAMRGMTIYYQNDVKAALRDSMDAVTAAAWMGHRRAEIVARNGCTGWLLCEMGHLDQARREFEEALAMARQIGARRFEPNSLTWLGKITAIEGRRAEGQALVEQSVAICRELGFAFVGPMALGALALVTEDAAVRTQAIEEGDAFLRAGRRASHNYLYFYRDAMEALLVAGELDGVERCAHALERYTSSEPLPWSRFFIERARTLIRYQRGKRDQDTMGMLTRLHAEACDVGLHTAAKALERALAE